MLSVATVSTAIVWVQTWRPSAEGGRCWSARESCPHVDVCHRSLAIWYDTVLLEADLSEYRSPEKMPGEGWLPSGGMVRGGFLGFDWNRQSAWPVGTYDRAVRTVIVVPLWAACLLLAAYPILAIVGALVSRRCRGESLDVDAAA